MTLRDRRRRLGWRPNSGRSSLKPLIEPRTRRGCSKKGSACMVLRGTRAIDPSQACPACPTSGMWHQDRHEGSREDTRSQGLSREEAWGIGMEQGQGDVTVKGQGQGQSRRRTSSPPWPCGRRRQRPWAGGRRPGSVPAAAAAAWWARDAACHSHKHLLSWCSCAGARAGAIQGSKPLNRTYGPTAHLNAHVPRLCEFSRV